MYEHLLAIVEEVAESMWKLLRWYRTTVVFILEDKAPVVDVIHLESGLISKLLDYSGLSTDLQTTDSDPEGAAGGFVAFLGLAFLLLRSCVHSILPRAHLQIEHARVLVLASQVLHQQILVGLDRRRAACARGTKSSNARAATR